MLIKYILLTLLLICQSNWLLADTVGTSLSIDRRHALVDRIITLVRENYVDPSMGEEVVRQLQLAVNSGAIADMRDPGDLAAALTGILRPMDRHFGVNWSAAGFAGPHEDADARANWAIYSQGQNFGFRRVEVRPGNIGYLDLRYFENMELARDTAIAAMGMLANSDAVIVDLRHNGGGEPEMVQFLSSYFFGAEPVHLNSLYWRPGNRTQEFWTLEELPGKRLPDVPLFVLTSPRTGSAAEEFAYNMKSLRRATLVGKATVGAANPGDVFDAGDGFAIFISTGKAINPVTGINWEAVGVAPDVEVASEQALQVAEELALKHLLSSISQASRRKAVQWAAEALHAQKKPRPLSKQQMQAYAGHYGDRLVFIEDDRLYYRRGKRQAYPMLLLAGDTFVLDGKEGFRTRFQRDDAGSIVRLLDMWVDGHQSAHKRDQ